MHDLSIQVISLRNLYLVFFDLQVKGSKTSNFFTKKKWYKSKDSFQNWLE